MSMAVRADMCARICDGVCVHVWGDMFVDLRNASGPDEAVADMVKRFEMAAGRYRGSAKAKNTHPFTIAQWAKELSGEKAEVRTPRV